MSMPRKVSVVIPCFNHGEFLMEAVNSVTAIGRADIELTVVDDGSTDERTRIALDKVAAQGIRVICQPNQGLAGARNAGIAGSSAEYILPLDADNRLLPGYVEHGIRILDANPKVGVVYGDAEYFGAKTGRWRVGPLDTDQILQWNSFDACAIYRRCIWEQNGGYDGTMPVQGLEDWDFWLSTLEHGWKVAYVPEVLFEYRVAEGSMIARANPHNAEVEAFIAKKHAQLYRQAWMRLYWEHRSVKLTVRNLGRLLKLRLNGDSVNRGNGFRVSE